MSESLRGILFLNSMVNKIICSSVDDGVDVDGGEAADAAAEGAADKAQQGAKSSESSGRTEESPGPPSSAQPPASPETLAKKTGKSPFPRPGQALQGVCSSSSIIIHLSHILAAVPCSSVPLVWVQLVMGLNPLLVCRIPLAPCGIESRICTTFILPLW